MFPAESIPDGNILAPHHLYIGVALTYFAFKYVWPRYPRLGASLTFVGIGIALDDAVSHAFGVWTPLDWGWKELKEIVGWLPQLRKS